MGLFDNFPYTNFHELNLMWILEALKEIQTTTEQFVAINSLKYADPIQWNIVTQYEKNTIVIDPLTGTAYISVQPVPSGVALTNTDYWTVVFDLGQFVVKAAKNFCTRYEEATTLTATFASSVNDWLIWGDTLYRALVNITAGDSYVVDSNIKQFTVEDVIGHIQDLNTTDKSNLVAAINEVLLTLQTTAGDLDNLTTTDKSNLVAAINEVLDALNLHITDINTKIDNLSIVNVKDYGATGDGVTDDTQAITDAIATGKVVYFPVGSYAVASLPASNADFIGWGLLVLPNTHIVPVHNADTATLYDTDFSNLSNALSWINNTKVNITSLYIASADISFNSNNLASYLNTGHILHLYPTNGIEHAYINCGTVYIHDPEWKNTTEVAHLQIDNNSICHVVGNETVHSKAANFHYWVMNASLYLTGVSVDVDTNCIFNFFLYAERGSYIQAYSYTWSGTTGTCWGASILENSYCESPVYDWTTYQTFFPTSHSTTPNVNSRDYLLSALAVGGRIGSIPDYGWKPYYGTSDYDLNGKSIFFAEDVPDIYSSLTIYGRDIKTSGNIFIQIRRFFENSYDASIGDYSGCDMQVPATPYTHPVTGNVNVGGVDYPISASCQLSSYVYKLENFSVSAAPFASGSGTIEFQLTFIQFAGLSRPQYLGWMVDGAGTKHYLQGFCNVGRIASIRAFTDQTFTQGKGNIILNA